MTRFTKFLVAGALLLCGAPVMAQTLTFEGLNNGEAIGQFYNGGLGGSGSGPGTNHGIFFSSNALAIIDSDAGGTGNIGGEPSPDTVMYFTSGTAIMSVPAGFTTGFSFYYSAVNNPASITVYDGLNGTGNVLATLALPTTPYNGAPDPNGPFSPFVPIGVTFAGTARSVDFGGTVNQVAFDNITIGSATPGTPGTMTCASEGYTGMKLDWCRNICEKDYTGTQLKTWIRRWMDRYHDLPYCMREDEETPPQEQGAF